MLKDVMLFAQAGVDRTSHVAAAVAVAKAHGAALCGVCAVDLPPMPAYAEAPIGVELIEQELDRRRAEGRRLETSFLDAARRAGVAAEWRTVEADPISVALEHGRAADLVVLSQADPDAGASARVVEELALSLGRPTLVVPHVGAPASIGENVLVAWNGSREATRAAHDALPFLRRAKSIQVAVVDPDGAQLRALEGFLAHLGRHGVATRARKLDSGGLAVGDLLLNLVSDEGIDLIVMGAYGHSRMRELVLGGATRTLVRQMTAPILFSH